MDSFAIGDKVTEPQHGFATVTFVGTESIGLRFEQSGQQALFRLGDSGPHRDWDESVLIKDESNRDAPPLPWPGSAFAAATAGVPHFMGSHSDPFYDGGAEALLNQLPAMLFELCPGLIGD